MHARTFLLGTFGAAIAFVGPAIAFAQPAAIHIDANKVLHRVTPLYIGSNIEDLNYQIYGGLYSQLIHGESFQEHVDSAVLGLTARQRLQVYIGESETGELEVWGIRTRQWEHNGAREMLGLPLKPESNQVTPPGVARPPGIPVTLDELPAEKRQALLAAATPERRVSRQWRSTETGSAKGTFGFERKSQFIGAQSQLLTFVAGVGEVGIENAGLNRWGINLVGGKAYDGMLRIKTSQNTTVWVSLLNANGSIKLAEKALKVKPGGGYQPVSFTLTPRSSDEKGHFEISLKAPGSITVGYAFLEPGPWGRFKDLEVRRDLAQAIVDQGIKVIRYNGSMVNRAPDSYLYKWKGMIGPRDLRKPYRGNFNVYASNGFGIFDFLSFAEAAGILPIPGIRTDETPEDMADFVEYVNGPATTTWGKRRAADGHPAPYGLRHLEIGNEETMNDAYCDRFEILAQAIWAKAPGMVLVVSHNLGQDPKVFEIGPGGEVSDRLKNAARLVRFAQDHKGTIWWDHHYGAQPRDYEQPGPAASLTIMRTFKQSIDKLVPGSDLQMSPLEENGPIHNMRRALVHARNLNAFFGMGDWVKAVAVANTLEAWDQPLVWDQGRTVFTSSKTIPQPPYFVDQAIARNWAPNVVQTTVDGVLDAQARTTEDGNALVLNVVNDKNDPIEASLNIAGFALGSAAIVVELTGSEDAVNTPSEPEKVRPKTRNWNPVFQSGVTRYTFPARSVTLIRFER